MGNPNIICKLKSGQVIISLGSNWGNTNDTIKKAQIALNHIGQIIKKTELLVNKPVGYINQPMFLNQLVLIETAIPTQQILQITQKIEIELGRKKKFKNAPRTIDIDIIANGQEKINSKELTIPHPGIYDREYLQILIKNLLESTN